ncbi:MAG: hypothetical protein ACJAUH_000734 [Saprospiraceae bacterium]|mgnify:CR=1 FL=1|jgi:hypothetical protein
MTKKDFFRILIKLFGLYVLINFAFSIVNTISNLFIDSYGLGFFEVGIYLGMLILLFLLFVVLVFKADTIIRWLRLDQGFDDEYIQFEKFSPKNVVKLALILIAGLMIIENIEVLIGQLTLYIQVRDYGIGGENISKYATIIAVAEIVTAYFLIREQNWIFSILKLDNTEEIHFEHEEEEEN